MIKLELNGGMAKAASIIDVPVYWCSMIAFMLSNRERRRSWLLSLANKKPGEDIEEKS
jgi:hypothetical protein